MDLEGDWYFAAAAADGPITRFMHGYQGFVIFRSVEDLLIGHEVCEGFVVALFLISISNYSIEFEEQKTYLDSNESVLYTRSTRLVVVLAILVVPRFTRCANPPQRSVSTSRMGNGVGASVVVWDDYRSM